MAYLNKKVIFLFIVLFSCQKRENRLDQKDFFKKIEGQWKLNEYHYYKSWHNPNGTFFIKIDIENGVSTEIYGENNFNWSPRDTTIGNYQMMVDYQEFKYPGIFIYQTTEISQEQGKDAVTIVKKYEDNLKGIPMEAIRFTYPSGEINADLDNNILNFKNNFYISTLSTQGSGNETYIFIRE